MLAPLPDLSQLVVWNRQDSEGFRRLSAVAHPQTTVFEVVTWYGGLAFLGGPIGTFVLGGAGDVAATFARYTPLMAPGIAMSALTPLNGIDFEWACRAIAWTFSQYDSAKFSSGRAGSGGPRGVRK